MKKMKSRISGPISFQGKFSRMKTESLAEVGPDEKKEVQ